MATNPPLSPSQTGHERCWQADMLDTAGCGRPPALDDIVMFDREAEPTPAPPPRLVGLGLSHDEFIRGLHRMFPAAVATPAEINHRYEYTPHTRRLAWLDWWAWLGLAIIGGIVAVGVGL